MPVKNEISLLPDENNANTLGGRILKYLTTVGRVIIIITELVVISAFISRFWLDRKNSDLSEIIRQQKAILESTQDFEKEYKLLAQKVDAIKNISASKPNFQPSLLTIAKSTPPDIVYKNLSISTSPQGLTSANLSIIVYKEESLIDFITNLTLNPDIQSVEISAIEKKINDTTYLLNLMITFASPKTWTN